MPQNRLSSEIIAAGIEGFEAQKKRIDYQIAELRSMLTGEPTTSAVMPSETGRPKRKISAAARRRMAEG